MGNAGKAQASGGGGAELLDCDIVMAGGVTSGIIYPGAVEVISRRYRFRSIGGASVGAIAAAATAAAEYGRLTGRNAEAFKQIGALPESLGQAGPDRRSRLFHLFTPDRPTTALYAFLTPLFAGGGVAQRVVAIAGAAFGLWSVRLAVAAVVLPGLVAWLRMTAVDPLLSLVVMLLTAASALLALAAATGLAFSRRLLPAWRANGYGVCTGMAGPAVAAKRGETAFEGLTPWMHGVIQRAAGRLKDTPLTFGDLWSARPAGKAAAAPAPRGSRAIELTMISSDLSRNRSVQLPFLESPSPLYVDIKTLEAYFPPDVVRWMLDHAQPAQSTVDSEGAIRLPRAEDLPVVFAARLSLSFPVLLSAVPLKTPDYAKGSGANGKVPLRRVWLSDGGLTSNFPIHFFDSPVPSRPTFCLNLVGFDAEMTTAGEDDDRDSADVVAPETGKAIATPNDAERQASGRPDLRGRGGDPQPHDEVWGMISMARGNRFIPAVFSSFDTSPGAGLGSFLAALLSTARSWSDNQLLLAPGTRDRVVNVALRDDEGGLNLNMSPKVIADLDWRGRAAGLLISARFDPERKTDPETGDRNVAGFDRHRWARFRNFMAAFEDMSRRFALSRRASDEAARRRGEPPIDDLIASVDHGYPARVGARDYFREITARFDDLALKMADRTRADPEQTFGRVDAAPGQKPSGGAPRPPMRLRLRPLADGDPRAETADLPERPAPDAGA